MFGITKETLIKTKITAFLPQFLIKKHQQSMALTLNDASFNTIKRDRLLLAMHTSGFLIPVRVTMVREISFSEISQFFTRFVEVQYTTQTLHMLISKNEIIEGATSGNASL